MKKEEMQEQIEALEERNRGLDAMLNGRNKELDKLKEKENDEITFLKGLVLHLTAKREVVKDKDGIIREYWKEATRERPYRPINYGI